MWWPRAFRTLRVFLFTSGRAASDFFPPIAIVHRYRDTADGDGGPVVHATGLFYVRPTPDPLTLLKSGLMDDLIALLNRDVTVRGDQGEFVTLHVQPVEVHREEVGVNDDE